MALSELPWKLHGGEGNLIIRSNDQVLGDVVAHVDEKEDADYIVNSVNERKKKLGSRTVNLFRQAYSELNNAFDASDQQEYKDTMEEIKSYLADFGYKPY